MPDPDPLFTSEQLAEELEGGWTTLAVDTRPRTERDRNGDSITFHLRYVIDPYKVEEFEAYGRMWIPLVERYGGTHHGYFLPKEGANNVAYALFSFPSLAEYETYRTATVGDPDCLAAWQHAEKTRCIVSFERTFLRPLTPEQ